MNENGISKSYSSSDMDDPSRKGGISKELEPESKSAHELDSSKNQKLFTTLQQWFDYEFTYQSENRYQMALDCEYYDGNQWSEEDAQVLMNRNQAPLVFNEIKSTIDWMIGTERRARIDHKVLPRKEGKEASDDAENKSQLLKYLSDVNKSPFRRSLAFEDTVKAGVGWVETGVRGDPTEELLFTRNEDWRNILHDSNSVEPDYSDARYLFRSRFLDEDIAVAYFPDRAELIESCVINGDQISLDDDDEDFWYMGARVTEPGKDFPTSSGRYRSYRGTVASDSTRPRVKLKECWYKVPVLKKKFNGGDFDNEPFDPKNLEHIEAAKNYSLYDKLELQVRCAIFCSAGLLFDGKSPYRHNRIPFVPIFCYRRKRDNQPYSAIRALRDPQDDLNKRHSKAQHILASNGIIMDKGAVDDIEELREESARPDYIIVKNPGKELTKDRDNALAEQHLRMMDADIAHIRNAGGVNNENLGRQTNTTSGIALQERKESGSVVTTAPFDNLHYAWQMVGELELSNVEQFYTEEKAVRIVGERGGTKFKSINKMDESGNILNDITKFQADFVVSEQDYRSSLRQAMFESLFEIVGRLAQMNPQVALNLLDLVVEMADLPNKDELVSRIRQMNGQADPDKEETPEEMIQRQAQEAKAKEMADLQEKLALKSAQAEVGKVEADIEKLQSQAMKDKIEAIYSALQTAGIVVTQPTTAPIADEILKGAGYKDTSIEENNIQQSQPIEPQQPIQQVPQGDLPSAAAGVQQGIETPQFDNTGV